MSWRPSRLGASLFGAHLSCTSGKKEASDSMAMSTGCCLRATTEPARCQWLVSLSELLTVAPCPLYRRCRPRRFRRCPLDRFLRRCPPWIQLRSKFGEVRHGTGKDGEKPPVQREAREEQTLEKFRLQCLSCSSSRRDVIVQVRLVRSVQESNSGLVSRSRVKESVSRKRNGNDYTLCCYILLQYVAILQRGGTCSETLSPELPQTTLNFKLCAVSC